MNPKETIEASVSSDLEQITKILPIRAGETLLELGCGPAESTCLLAQRFPDLKIIATDVDQIQHQKNMDSDYPHNLTFQFGGAQNINMPDSSVNYAIMLKSFHHVPIELMDQSLNEIGRVLVPGGWVYISEPVYAGEFNNILRLFHDEKECRQAAVNSMGRAVAAGKFQRDQQIYFDTISRFEGFAEFEQRIIGATHTKFNVDERLRKKIKAAFDPFVGSNGIAEFRSPRRVDLMRTQS